MVVYIKSKKKNKVTVENAVTGIITSFDDEGGMIEVSGSKVIKGSTLDLPLFNTVRVAQQDLKRHIASEINRTWVDVTPINLTEDEYNGRTRDR